MTTIELTAPSYWAPYLINGDDSSLNAVEKLACDDWLKAEGVYDVVDCRDYGWTTWHDAFRFVKLGADCQYYTCIVKA